MKKTIFLSVIIILSFFSLNNASAQVHKYQAVYIYNFSQYIEWPQSYKTGNFIIGVYGNDKILAELKKIAAAKKVKGQKIVIKQYTNTSQIGTAHILFVPSRYSKYIPTIKSKISNKSTLLVTNSKGSINKGAAINFLLISNKLRFELSKSNAKKQKLKVSPTLSKLASKNY